MARSLVLLLLGLLLAPLSAEEPAARPAPEVYPGLAVALPMEAGLSVRWVYPPLEKAALEKAYLYDVRLAVDAEGTPWLGYKGNALACPAKGLLLETPRRYRSLCALPDGALLLATDSDWGYLLPPTARPGAKKPPVPVYQPVAELPVPKAELFPGEDGLLFFVGKHPDTGRHHVYGFRPGSQRDGDVPGPIAYVHLFTAEKPIRAVAGNMGQCHVAIGDLILTVSPHAQAPLATQRIDGNVLALASTGELIFYATYTQIGALTPQGQLPLLNVVNPRLALQGEHLYIALPDTLGVLALEHATRLASLDLAVPEAPANATAAVKLTDVRCFTAGETAPPLEERAFATTLTRTLGEFLYVQAEIDNLQPARTHTENVRFVVARENGSLYYQNTVTFTFEPDTPGLWGWARFGTADFPPYPGDYVITTYLNGVKADTRPLTITGPVTATEAAVNFDQKRLEAALKRGDNANARIDGTPLLVQVARGLSWDGPTPEVRRRRSVDTIRLLLKYRADVNARDANGETALHQAARSYYDNSEIIGLLLKAGADVNARANTGETPLRAAMLFGRPENVRALLVKGITVDIRDQYERTPLHEAASHGHRAVVELLLKVGANPNLADKYGETALFAAARHPEILQVLLAAGANPNATATIFNRTQSLLGYVLDDWYGISEDWGPRAQAVQLLRARGADLLPAESQTILSHGRYRLLDQAFIERQMTRTPELLPRTEELDDPLVQRAAIAVLLARARAQVASATAVWHYQAALRDCTAARERMEKYLQPPATRLPEVYYNCARLEAHLGDFAAAQQHLARYLELAPKAKDARQVQQLQAQYAAQEAALREPIAPATLAGIWWPDGEMPDREKFFRVEFALRDGQLQGRVLAQTGWAQNYPASRWVPATVQGNTITLRGAVFYNSATGDNSPYTTEVTMTRIGEGRLVGTLEFSGYKLEDGKTVPNRGSGAFEWRRRP